MESTKTRRFHAMAVRTAKFCPAFKIRNGLLRPEVAESAALGRDGACRA